MTNEEAKCYIRTLLEVGGCDGFDYKQREALNMAIKAFEMTCTEDYPTCTECEHYDKDKHYCPRFCQVIKDTLAEAQPSEEDFVNHKKEVLERIAKREREIDKYIKELEALEQQPSEDTEVIKVSKGAVKARQGKYVIYDVDWLKENFYTTEEKIYGQPKQPCEDAVSRTLVHEAITASIAESENPYEMWQRIETLPPVTPQRPKGKWILNSDYPDRLICDKCNAQFDMWHWESKQMHYCPNCGAEMSGGGEDGEDSACG